MHKANTKGLIGKVFGWNPRPLEPARETAWLDGVRGMAALLVVANHYNAHWLSGFAGASFGAEVLQDRNIDDIWYYYAHDRLWEPWRLPILRLFICAGGAQVNVFFILSGFVLSWGFLHNMQNGNNDRLFSSLSSSIIRRWLRLFLPCFAVAFIYRLQTMKFDGIVSILQQLWHFVKVNEQWSNPFALDRIELYKSINEYCFVMWTIPFEFSGSLFVFAMLLVIGRTQDYFRRTLISTAMALYALLSQYWAYWLFGSGLILADYVVHRGGFKKLSQQTTTSSRCIWSGVFLFGLLLLGIPEPNVWFSAPGLGWLATIPLMASSKTWICSSCPDSLSSSSASFLTRPRWEARAWIAARSTILALLVP